MNTAVSRSNTWRPEVVEHFHLRERVLWIALEMLASIVGTAGLGFIAVVFLLNSDWFFYFGFAAAVCAAWWLMAVRRFCRVCRRLEELDEFIP